MATYQIMKVLVVTGRLAEDMVMESVSGVDVLVMDVDVASFITPEMLREAAPRGYDLILIPGAITSDFGPVERALKTTIRLGSKHAADLGYVIKNLDTVELSTTVPACVLLKDQIREDALVLLDELEASAVPALIIKGVKVGGQSRMKVLAEIVDATRLGDRGLFEKVVEYERKGADMIDLGTPLDATPDEVAAAVVVAKSATDLPVSVDTVRPDLIRAGVCAGADLILSLNGDNLEVVGPLLAREGVPAVVIPGPRSSLEENLASAEALGAKVMADSILSPPLLGLAESVKSYLEFHRYHPEIPIFLGVGNVTELLDADSPGVNGLMTAIGSEVGASILFTPEYSEKAKGSVGELRTASEMMALAGSRRTSPKDLGIDLLILKEKRRRFEAILPEVFEVAEADYRWEIDPAGSFKIGVAGGRIVAEHQKTTVVGKRAIDVLNTLIDRGLVTRLDHAGYLGRELQKAEIAIELNRSYNQDDPLFN